MRGQCCIAGGGSCGGGGEAPAKSPRLGTPGASSRALAAFCRAGMFVCRGRTCESCGKAVLCPAFQTQVMVICSSLPPFN